MPPTKKNSKKSKSPAETTEETVDKQTVDPKSPEKAPEVEPTEETPKKKTPSKGKAKKADKPKEVEPESSPEKAEIKEGKKEVTTPTKRRIPNIRMDPIPKKLKPIDEKRRRKVIDRLALVASPVGKKSAPVFEIPEGKGTKLKKCPNVAAHFARRTNKDPLLRTIHGLLIGRPNKSVKVKDNLGKFSGLVYADEDGRSNFTARIERLKIRTIRDMLAFFGQEPKGDKDDIVTRLVDFFENPQPSDKEYKCSPRSRGLSPTPVKKLKKPLSSYMLFCKEKRTSVSEKYPDDTFGAISKRLGEMWSNLKEDDKEEYEEAATKERAKYQRARKKLMVSE